MPPPDWTRVKTLVADALEIDAGRREAWVREACGGDADLQAEVESLLASHDGLDGFIETPASTDALEAVPPMPSTVGAYRIVGLLGRGGMGTVYLGRRVDEAYDKDVAIKIVRRGTDTDEVVRRFRQERQLLARLDHPDIVRLLDGGTTDDGLPYFVMDYVRGEPIDEYCRRRGLTLPERLALFGRVLAPVQFAHRNLVVHRDLKPTNILVTPDGEPRLLDFGVAKLLDPAGPEGLTTEAAQRPMTADYASPEEVEGRPVTTASDVYSLGVLLYELLTGRRPRRLRGLSLDDVRDRLSRPVPPPSAAVVEPAAPFRLDEPPGRLRAQLRGDLDAIVMTAMHVDPERRYASVDQLAEDLWRHGQALPVHARPDTAGYRARRFLRRHWKPAAAAGALLVSLVAGLGATLWQTHVAREERARAERRFDDVRQLANAYLFEFSDAIAQLPGSTEVRARSVSRALAFLDGLAAESSEHEPALRAELAAAYAKVGEIQWNRYYANLGNATGAYESQRKALTMRQRLAAQAPGDTRLALDLAASHVLLGDTLVAVGRLTDAIEHYRRSLTIREAVVARMPGDRDARFGVAVSHQRLGDNLGNPSFENLGDTAGSLTHYRAMQDIFAALAREHPDDASARHAVSIGAEKLGDVSRGAGDGAGALARYEESLDARRALVAGAPNNGRYRRDLAVALGKVGLACEIVGDTARAARSYEELLSLRDELARLDPSDAGARYDAAVAHRQVAEFHARHGDAARARQHVRDALLVIEPLARADPANTEYARLLRDLRAWPGRTGPQD